jgi:hypothetical protein
VGHPVVRALHVLPEGFFVSPPADHEYFGVVSVGSPYLEIDESRVGFDQACAIRESRDQIV